MSLTYDVWATKDGMKRRFTQSCWDLVGPNKNGWTLMEDSVISNVLDSVEKPSTGQKTILNSNMENILIEKPILNPNIENILIEKKTNADAEIFIKAAEGLKRGDIKDFFDKQTPAVVYKNNSNAKDLITHLGEFLNFDIVELQKNFS